MSDISDRDARQPDRQAEPDIIEMLPCTCIQHPFAALPPDLQPRQAPRVSGLRKATCPGCGLIYRTNRDTDLCAECEKR